MKYLNGRILLGVIAALCLMALMLIIPRMSRAQVAVLSDQQLMEWARDTYARQDWIYAALHLNALAQRNPPLLSNNPTLAQEVNEGLKYSIQKLQEYKATADACSKNTTSTGGTNSVGMVHQGLTTPPPRIDFPK
jgi:hypothetical protein